MARKICTESEYDLVKSTYETGLRASKVPRLKEKASVLRKLRDKYRTMARRGERGLRKRNLSLPVTEHPKRKAHEKAAIFSEALDRIETELEHQRETFPHR